MTKISVIIPCFNASSQILKCLQMLENQTFTDFDVVCVDDCSIDNTVSVIESFMESTHLHISLLKNRFNSSPAYSRKNAAEHSESEYLAFCDSDDWYDSDYLEKANEVILRRGSDMVVIGYKMIVPKGQTIQHSFCKVKLESADKSAVYVAGISALWSLVIKKDLFLSVPHPNLRNGEDMAVIPLFIEKSKDITILPDRVYNYVSNPQSASNKASIKVVESLLASFEHVEKNMSPSSFIFLEYIGVQRILYGTILNLFKVSCNKERANLIVENFLSKYPNWERNPYIKYIPKFKKLFIYLVARRWYVVAYYMSIMHKKITV